MRKQRKCDQCGDEFPLSIRVNGRLKSLGGRKSCLKCSPYRGSACKSIICKKCDRKFDARCTINGKRIGLYDREYCLECVPFGERADRWLKPKREPEKKICTVCGDPYIYDRSKGHKAKRCNSCSTVKYQIAKKIRAIEYKGGSCACCGYNKYYGALGFHHLDPKKKDFQIGGSYSRKWSDLLVELDKCVLVCHNCHAEIHAGFRQVPDECYSQRKREDFAI